MVQAAFVVFINENGTISTEALKDEVQRVASTFDMYQASKELASDIESQLLADRVARTVIAALTPVDPMKAQRDKIKEALNERKSEAPVD